MSIFDIQIDFIPFQSLIICHYHCDCSGPFMCLPLAKAADKTNSFRRNTSCIAGDFF